MALIGLFGPEFSGKKVIGSILTSSFKYEKFVVGGDNTSSQDSVRGYMIDNSNKDMYAIIDDENVREYLDIFMRRSLFVPVMVYSSALHRFKRSRDTDPERVMRENTHARLVAPVITLINDQSLEELEKKVKILVCTVKETIRPGWDTYFTNIAVCVSSRSNCMKRKVGCIITTKDSHRILSTGYNGTPHGVTNCMEGGCQRCSDSSNREGKSLDTCLCIHAEESALMGLSAYRNKDAVLYSTLFPCIMCAKKIVQYGIKEVVYIDNYYTSAPVYKLFEEACVKCRQVSRLSETSRRYVI